MKKSKCHLQIGMTESCTKIITEDTKGVGQRDMKVATKAFSFWKLVLLKKVGRKVDGF